MRASVARSTIGVASMGYGVSMWKAFWDWFYGGWIGFFGGLVRGGTHILEYIFENASVV